MSILIRVAVVAAVGFLVGVPVARPWLAALTRFGAVGSLTVYCQSLGLLALVTLGAVPVGIAAVAVPARWLAAALFVPLPLVTAAWIGVLPGIPNRLPANLLTAALIHAIAAVPWVAWFVGRGLAVGEPEMLDDLATSAPPAVQFGERLRRCRPIVAFAAVVVAGMTVTEMTVADVVQLRTWAEDVYTELIAPSGGTPADVHDAAAAATAQALFPLTVLGAVTAGVAVWAVSACPPLLGPARSRAGSGNRVVGGALAAGLLGVPVYSLAVAVARAPAWPTLQLLLVLTALTMALASGVIATGLAVAAAAAARSRVSRAALFVAAVVVALTPGPVVGIGLKGWIDDLIDHDPTGWARLWLYDAPSPVPAVWACAIRAWPLALALVWPVARATPTSWLEAVRADGGSVWDEFRLAVWPTLAPAIGPAVVLSAAFSAGEVAASKLVATPGWSGGTFAHFVFSRLHYGLKPDLAAACLLALAVVVGVACVCGAGRQRPR